jgi:hypothetical protein
LALGREAFLRAAVWLEQASGRFRAVVAGAGGGVAGASFRRCQVRLRVAAAGAGGDREERNK